jgi:hypothetical protein
VFRVGGSLVGLTGNYGVSPSGETAGTPTLPAEATQAFFGSRTVDLFCRRRLRLGWWRLELQGRDMDWVPGLAWGWLGPSGSLCNEH